MEESIVKAYAKSRITGLLQTWLAVDPSGRLKEVSKVAKQTIDSADEFVRWATDDQWNLMSLLPVLGPLATIVVEIIYANGGVVNQKAKDIVDMYSYKPDAFDDNANIMKYEDEFELIESVAARLGSYEKLAQLLAVIRMDPKILELHYKTKKMVN
jgi:hypothetical protein